MAEGDKREGVSRKTFVQVTSAGLAAAGLASCNNQQQSAAGSSTALPTTGTTSPMARPAATSAATGGSGSPGPSLFGSQPEAYSFLTTPEQRFIEAAVERIIPTDAAGVGAKDAGVPFYIDQQLNADYGYAARMYMQGPFLPGTPEQGYQLPLIPRDVFRIGIRETNAWCAAKYGAGKTFEQLTTSQQDATLVALDKGSANLPSLPGKQFFQMLLAVTVEGFFADPIYGGNRDMVGWRLVGFPGAAAYWRNQVTQHNQPFTPTPMGLAQLEEQEQQPMPAASGAMPSGTMSGMTRARGLRYLSEAELYGREPKKEA